MRYLRLGLTVALIIAAMLLAANNREPVTVSLWPVGDLPELPLFLWLLAAMLIGIVLGGLVVWWDQRQVRRAARQRGREVARLQAEAAKPVATP